MGIGPGAPWVPPQGTAVHARRGVRGPSLCCHTPSPNGTFQSGWSYRISSVVRPRTELIHLLRPLLVGLGNSRCRCLWTIPGGSEKGRRARLGWKPHRLQQFWIQKKVFINWRLHLYGDHCRHREHWKHFIYAGHWDTPLLLHALVLFYYYCYYRVVFLCTGILFCFSFICIPVME